MRRGWGVGRQATAGVGQLLAEAIELALRQAPLEECSSVNAGGGVPLEKDLVSASGCIGAAEKVVEAHLVERCRRRVGRDVAADADAGPLSSVHHDGRIPADELADATLESLITGEPRLDLRRDGVDVVSRAKAGNAHIAFGRSPQQGQHEITGAIGPGSFNELVEGCGPLSRLLGVHIDVLRGQAAGQERLRAQRVEAWCHWIPFAGGASAVARHRADGPILAHRGSQRRRAPGTHE